MIWALALAVPFLAGLLVGRPWVLSLPAAWLAFFGGLEAGWWGSGTGDAWQWALASLVAGGLAAAAAGLALRRALGQLGQRRPRR